MYEDGIRVTYRTRNDDDPTETRWSAAQDVVLPGWCAGDPHTAVTLYLFGHSSLDARVLVDDWQPLDGERDDEVDQDKPQARGHLIRTGHKLTGYYVPTADAGIVRLVKTCGCP